MAVKRYRNAKYSLQSHFMLLQLASIHFDSTSRSGLTLVSTMFRFFFTFKFSDFFNSAGQTNVTKFHLVFSICLQGRQELRTNKPLGYKPLLGCPMPSSHLYHSTNSQCWHCSILQRLFYQGGKGTLKGLKNRTKAFFNRLPRRYRCIIIFAE